MSETKRGCCGGATREEAAAAEVCSLPPDDLQERLAMIRADFAPRVLRRERLPDGRAWAFEAAMRPDLARLVALERACCSGLAWSLREDGATTWLEVRGPGVDALPELDART
jgi:hypothetical protein